MQYANGQSPSNLWPMTPPMFNDWSLNMTTFQKKCPMAIFWFCFSHQGTWSKYTSCCLLGLAPVTFDTLRGSTESFLNSLCERSPVIDFLLGCFVRESMVLLETPPMKWVLRSPRTENCRFFNNRRAWPVTGGKCHFETPTSFNLCFGFHCCWWIFTSYSQLLQWTTHHGLRNGPFFILIQVSSRAFPRSKFLDS